MATDEVVTLPVTGDNGVRSIQLPEGWIESAQVQARRIGQQIVLDPVVPETKAPTHDGAVQYREEAGLRVHPSWPPGYFESLREAQESGELEIGDPEELRRAFNDPRPE